MTVAGAAHPLACNLAGVLHDIVVDENGIPQDLETPTADGNGMIYDPDHPVLPDVLVTGTVITNGPLGLLRAATLLDCQITCRYDSLPEQDGRDVATLGAASTELIVTSAFQREWGAVAFSSLVSFGA